MLTKNTRDDKCVRDTQDEEVLHQSKLRHQVLHQWPGDKAGKAEAHDGETGRKAAVAREILDQRGHGGNVADAQTNAANDAVEQVQQRQAGKVQGQCGAQKACAKARRTDKTAFARAHFFDA